MEHGVVNQTISLQDGRSLGFAQYGAPSGRPLFFFHGSASSRLDRPAAPGFLEKLDIRFISVDRPGHGLSDFQANRCLLDWPEDIRQLADKLHIDAFHLLGQSAGGPYVLACANRLPDRVQAAAVVSSVAPMNRPHAYDGMPLANQFLARSARHMPWITSIIRRMMRSMVIDDAEQATQQLMSSIPDSDKELLYTPENVAVMVATIQEGFRQGHQGVALDDVLVNKDWGFELADIQPRIDIWQGTADVNVPFHAGEYLHNTLPNCRAFFIEDEGHFFLLKSWDAVITVLMEPESA